MLYYFFKYLNELGISGAGVFNFITFRASLAGITALLFALIAGKRIIEYLQKLQIGETIRDLGLEGQMQKKGTPTMGGVIIILAILIPTILFAKLDNIYVIIMLLSTLWMGIIGGHRRLYQGLQEKQRGHESHYQANWSIILGNHYRGYY